MDHRDQLIQELMHKIAILEACVEKQTMHIGALLARIDELEKRLNKNSRNSSKPPSSDGLAKPPPKSLRQKGKNKSGGQPGHVGETLKQTAHPDKIDRHQLMECPACKASLVAVTPIAILKRQVFDIPLPQVIVTEHQAEIKICPSCHHRATAPFPHGVNAPAQYGDVIQSWSVYFQQQQLIPEDRAQEILSDLIDVKLATATLNRFSESMHDALADFDSIVLSKIQTDPVKHLDETGFRITGKTQWLHVASTAQLTHYHVSPNRKSLLDGLTGTVVHDHWKPYYQLPDVLHALCNQHHLRELQTLIEHDKEAWARKMQRFLRFALHYRHAYANQLIPYNKLNRLTDLYDRITHEGIAFHEHLPPLPLKPKRGRMPHRTGHNLLLRLKNNRADVLRFLFDPTVPFTNNQAERDLRMMKCKQKISGGFRTEKGAKIFARIRGFISTARKQGWNIFESIQQVIRGSPPIPV